MTPGKAIAIKMQLRDALLTTIEDHLELVKNSANTMSIGELKARKDIAVSSFADFKDAHKGVLNACQRPGDITVAIDVCDRATSVHLQVLAVIEAETETQLEARPMLPSINEIRLQKFNGNITDWVEWRTNFEEKVLKTRLTYAQKIDLLLDSLEGDAKNTAGKSERRDQDDLNRIWGKLVLNYDNPYQQVYAHIFAIISLPTIDSPSTESFRHMINLVEEHMRLLGKYDVGSPGWGPLLCVILLHKLDAHSRYLWNTGDKPMLPNLESLFKFLQQRSRALEDESRCKEASLVLPNTRPPMAAINHRFEQRQFNSGRSNNIPNLARREEAKPYHRPPQANQGSLPCSLCKAGTHPLGFCNKFIEMNLTQRRQCVMENHCCLKCLRSNHFRQECRNTRVCKFCSSTVHHSLLCDKIDESRQAN